MSTRAIELLHDCRLRLQGALDPLDIAKYRDELSSECNVEEELRALKETQAREIALQQRCVAVRDLPNKMEFASATKEAGVARNRAKALATRIDHALRHHDVVTSNRKRARLEVERLDDVLLVAQIELSEIDDAPSLREEAQDYVPLGVAREEALARLRATLRALEEVRETSRREEVAHRDHVYDLKTEIKATRANLSALEAGTYAPALEVAAGLAEKGEAQTRDLDSRRKAIEDEIERTEANMVRDTLVHNANLAALQNKERELKQKLTDTTENNAAAMWDKKSELAKVKEENSVTRTALERLEARWAQEQEEARLRRVEQDEHHRRRKERKDREEREYFAAFNIQLQWKRYLKRKAHAAKSKKKGKKGKKGKKKK